MVNNNSSSLLLISYIYTPYPPKNGSLWPPFNPSSQSRLYPEESSETFQQPLQSYHHSHTLTVITSQSAT